MDFFGKPLDQIDADDILGLIDTPEGQLFEIKSKLAADKNSSDTWYFAPESGKLRKGPADYAKENVFKEVVAFANSEGGWLVLGLTETSDHPKRVKEVEPLPDCHALAERLKRSAYEWIDPPLPSLQCRGVEIGSILGEGVIVFRVPRSLDAPHRLYKKGRALEAYKRVGDESKPMRMREIQGLTLDMAKGQERIDREFNNARERYLSLKPQHSPKRRLVGFNITTVPLAGPVMLDRPYLKPDLFERKMEVDGIFNIQSQKFSLETIDSREKPSISVVKPILRGGRKTWSVRYRIDHRSQLELDEEDLINVEIFDSGTIQLSVKSTFNGLSSRWILADIANSLRITEKARIIGWMPDTEYAMEVELKFDDTKYYFVDQELKFGLLNEDDLHFSHSLIPILLPRYRVGSRADFSRVLKLVMDDLYNSVGKTHIDDFEFCPIC